MSYTYKQTNIHTLWLLESPDLINWMTKKTFLVNLWNEFNWKSYVILIIYNNIQMIFCLANSKWDSKRLICFSFLNLEELLNWGNRGLNFQFSSNRAWMTLNEFWISLFLISLLNCCTKKDNCQKSRWLQNLHCVTRFHQACRHWPCQ